MKNMERQPRFISWEDYGIDKARYMALQKIVQSGKHSDLARSAAYTANKSIAEYILLSVTEKLSYEGLQRLWELREIERMPCGRSDFYGYRRLFFHHLDCALKDMEKGVIYTGRI